MTLQTLVVLMIGAALLAPWLRDHVCVSRGMARSGCRCLPVGWRLAPLLGRPQAICLDSFQPPWVTGWLSERGWDRSVIWLFARWRGHLVILAARLWLARLRIGLGVEKAWLVGIVPFVARALVKNALGAAWCRPHGVWQIAADKTRKPGSSI